MIPSKATGYGNNSTARNVFAITFSSALSGAPQFEAYDGGSYPGTGTGTSYAGKTLVGTAGNGNRPMLCLVDTSAVAPISNWKPTNPTAGPVTGGANRLKGQTSYVVSGMTPNGGAGVGAYNIPFTAGAGNLGNATGAAGSTTNPTGVLRWNEMAEIPSDVSTSDNLTYDLLIRYQYTGAPPTLNWYYNDGGTESTPIWTQLTPGTHGLRHCDTGTVAGNYKLTIPVTGTIDSSEGWITT